VGHDLSENWVNFSQNSTLTLPANQDREKPKERVRQKRRKVAKQADDEDTE
jgi:hypothetical protein